MTYGASGPLPGARRRRAPSVDRMTAARTAARRGRGEGGAAGGRVGLGGGGRGVGRGAEDDGRGGAQGRPGGAQGAGPGGTSVMTVVHRPFSGLLRCRPAGRRNVPPRRPGCVLVARRTRAPASRPPSPGRPGV